MTVRVCPICDIADCATHRPSAQPIDPAAIREAALQACIETLEREWEWWRDECQKFREAALREAAAVARNFGAGDKATSYALEVAILALIGETK